MSNDQGVLEQFWERDEQNRKEALALERELGKKREEQERRQAAVQVKIDKEKAVVAKLKAEYRELEASLLVDAENEIEASSATIEKVKNGEASLAEYFADGLSAKAAAEKAREETKKKMSGALKIIKAKAAEIFKLEGEEAQARREALFTIIFPGQNHVARLKDEIQFLEKGVADISVAYFKAVADTDKASLNVGLCSDKALSGLAFDRLSYEELKDLRFDPRFTEKYQAQLEDCISKMGPDQHCLLNLYVSGFGRAAELVFRILD